MATGPALKVTGFSFQLTGVSYPKRFSIKKKKDKIPFLKGPLKKFSQKTAVLLPIELFLQDRQKESNLACFMASVAPSSPTLVVGAVWKTTILGKPALIITKSQGCHLIYI